MSETMMIVGLVVLILVASGCFIIHTREEYWKAIVREMIDNMEIKKGR